MKVLALDFDNTLYFKNENPPIKEIDQQALKTFQGKGNKIGVCTGRGIASIEKDHPGDYLSFDFYILGSGGRILDKDKNVLYEDIWDLDIVESISKEYIDKVEAISFHEEEIYTVYQKPRKGYPVVYTKEEFPKKIHSVSFVCYKDTDIVLMAKEVEEKYPMIAAYPNVSTIDMALKGTSKGTGVSFIKEYFNAKTAIGIGDSFNDIPMMTCSDIKVAMKKGMKALQDVCDMEVENIAEAIEKIGG